MRIVKNKHSVSVFKTCYKQTLEGKKKEKKEPSKHGLPTALMTFMLNFLFLYVLALTKTSYSIILKSSFLKSIISLPRVPYNIFYNLEPKLYEVYLKKQL